MLCGANLIEVFSAVNGAKEITSFTSGHCKVRYRRGNRTPIYFNACGCHRVACKDMVIFSGFEPQPLGP
jgi:hypothetical protein